MAGGSGTRFWPVSRSRRPKQFLALVGERSLLRQAFDRAAAMSGEQNVYVASGAAQRDMVMQALPGFDPRRLIVEPIARNTAPCVGLAALRLLRVDQEAVMVVWPADHVYTNQEALRQAIELAVAAADSGPALVTLGITPSRPETGYGYIEVQDGAAAGPGARRAARFVEKPDLATAREYVASGRFLWNSGVFAWKVGSILRQIETCAPGLWSGLQTIAAAMGQPAEERIISETFASLPSISIDHAVMEKTQEVLVVPVDPGWSDVGSWDAAADLHATDAAGNAFAGDPGAVDQVVLVGSRDCFVYASGDPGRPIALVGVEDLIVVDAGDALLVCRRGDSQSVRAVVEALKVRGRNDVL